jgi:hypothetical protein
MPPQRIQRQRGTGWRPSKWGNPFRIESARSRRDGPRDMWAVTHRGVVLVRFDTKHAAAADAVDRYRQSIRERGLEGVIRIELAGRDLMCWCNLDLACHATALLEIASGAP